MMIFSAVIIIQFGLAVSLSGDHICNGPILGHSSFFPHHSTYAYCCEDFHEVNGLCEGCPAGQYGLKCNLSCPADHYGFRCKYKCNCFNDGVCHKVNGCVCNDGFSGDSCEKVKACPPGKFGNRCQQMCNCSGGFTCDSKTGKCVCPTQDLCNHGNTTKSNVQGVKTPTFIKDTTSEALYQRVTQTYDGAVADSKSNYRTDRGQVVCEPLVIYNIVVVCALVFIWLLIILYTVKKKYLLNEIQTYIEIRIMKISCKVKMSIATRYTILENRFNESEIIVPLLSFLKNIDDISSTCK